MELFLPGRGILEVKKPESPKVDDDYDEDEDDEDQINDTFQPFNSKADKAGSSSEQAPLLLQDPSYWGTAAVTSTGAADAGLSKVSVERLLADFYPEFLEGGSVKFSDLFAPRYSKVVRQKKISRKGNQRQNAYNLGNTQLSTFLNRGQQSNAGRQEVWGLYQRRWPTEDSEAMKLFERNQLPNVLETVVLDDWEDHVVWEDASNEDPSAKQPKSTNLIRNSLLDKEDWVDSIVWDSDEWKVPPPFVIEDPTIINDLKSAPVDEKKVTSLVAALESDGSQRVMLDEFNLSNDRFYENLHKKEHVRQSHGAVTLQHSLPAITLMHPYYKTQLSIKELRSFHRPQMRFPIGENISFSRVKGTKKIKKGFDENIWEEIKSLTLKDTSKFVLLEYSEEYPMLMSNFGMGSIIHTYYRKADEKDTFVPSLDVGIATVLDKVDASPFLNFGDVKAGETLQGLTNNLIRAPIFNHRVPETDFLLVKHTFKQKSKYYLREIPHLFVVGQSYPMVEVPRPQSRKVTNALKSRLQVISYRMMRTNPNERLWYPKLLKYYVGQSELQLKQRLKEFAQFWKKGENTGWWKLKQGKVLLNEEEIRKLLTPEMVCLCETALAGEQRLRDIGYVNMDFNNENEEDDATADIEVRLAPWTTTKNFVMATQGKGMIKLYGDGDPTGRGEGFSMIRQSMKEMFYRESEAAVEKQKGYTRFSISEQQAVYKEEIRRIWSAQLKALRSEVEPEITDDEDEMENMKHKKSIRKSDGSLEWKPEIVNDSRVINAYLRQRKLIESQISVTADGIKSGAADDDIKKQRRKKTQDQIIKLKEKAKKAKKKDRKESGSGVPGTPDVSTPAPPTLKLKIALGPSSASSSSMEKKRKTETGSVAAFSTPSNPKLILKHKIRPPEPPANPDSAQ
ncbi:hypothetical protein HDV05_004941 [Chytridiales sp. JEL 0842]|nr:hypothetical protein HDV05_004941 [Chytridiales sp. JEL 0842]